MSKSIMTEMSCQNAGCQRRVIKGFVGLNQASELRDVLEKTAHKIKQSAIWPGSEKQICPPGHGLESLGGCQACISHL